MRRPLANVLLQLDKKKKKLASLAILAQKRNPMNAIKEDKYKRERKGKKREGNII